MLPHTVLGRLSPADPSGPAVTGSPGPSPAGPCPHTGSDPRTAAWAQAHMAEGCKLDMRPGGTA